MRTAKEPVLIETCPLTGSLKEFQPITIHLVNHTDLESVWDYLVRTYHYLGFNRMIGPGVKYLACHGDTPLAALSYNRAALRVLDDVGLGPNQVPELGGLLNDFLGPFRDCYVRSDQREDGEAFVKGFLFRPRPEVDSHRSPLLMINTPG
jgi:hypothetical protein